MALVSVRPSVRPLLFRQPHYIFHRIKKYRLYSYGMKMCKWFYIFGSAIFVGVTALAVSDLVPATPATSFIRLT